MFSRIELLADFGLHILMILGMVSQIWLFWTFPTFLLFCPRGASPDMRPREAIGLENLGGTVLVDDLEMGLLGGFGNRSGTDLENGIVGIVLGMVLGLALCRFDDQRSP